MKKRGPKPKIYSPEVREFVVAKLREGYSLNSVSRASDVGENQVIRWRDEEGIKPITNTNGNYRKLPELEFLP